MQRTDSLSATLAVYNLTKVFLTRHSFVSSCVPRLASPPAARLVLHKSTAGLGRATQSRPTVVKSSTDAAVLRWTMVSVSNRKAEATLQHNHNQALAPFKITMLLIK